jgi:hypothetical protein
MSEMAINDPALMANLKALLLGLGGLYEALRGQAGS